MKPVTTSSTTPRAELADSTVYPPVTQTEWIDRGPCGGWRYRGSAV